MTAAKKAWKVDLKNKIQNSGKLKPLYYSSMQLLLSETDFSEHTLVFHMMAETITHFW